MLKIIYKYLTLLLALSMSVIITTSCSNKNESLDGGYINTNSQQSQGDKNLTEKESKIITDNQETIEKEVTNNYEDTTNEAKEKAVITLFESEANTMSKVSSSDTFNKIKDKSISVFKDGFDFVFNNKEINGITFNELTEEGKDKVKSAISKIDQTIENYSPDYKDKIGDKYQQFKDFSRSTIEKGKDKIKDKIGEDTYDDIIEEGKKIIEEDKQMVKDLWNKGKNWFNSKK